MKTDNQNATSFRETPLNDLWKLYEEVTAIAIERKAARLGMLEYRLKHLGLGQSISQVKSLAADQPRSTPIGRAIQN